MDDMLKPKRKLEDKMNYEQSLQWFIEFRRHITLESNERFLDAQTPSVRRGILEGCISASFATQLRAKAVEETPLDECLYGLGGKHGLTAIKEKMSRCLSGGIEKSRFPKTATSKR